MTEPFPLGAADAEPRWIGIRRHQAVLVVMGTGLVGDWITRSGAGTFELAVGLVTLAGALPGLDGVTVFESAVIGLGFLARRRWTRVGVQLGADGVRVLARGEASVQGYDLAHHGRLDLSGGDRALVGALAALVDGLSTTSGIRHLSIHVSVGSVATSTILALSPDVEAPGDWRRRDGAITGLVEGSSGGSTWRRESWCHLREASGVVRVLRIDDFSGVRAGSGLLERLQHAVAWSELALHVEVVGGPRAQRVAARAVHGTGSDAAVSSSAGFRRTARSARGLERLSQREALVASGRALIRVGVFIVVRAPSVWQLEESVTALDRSVRAAGLRCRHGAGRQAVWYCQQLPGGPGW